MDGTADVAILFAMEQGGASMQSHEYKVVPAPKRGIRVKGARRAEDRFARAIEAEMNRMAAEGWEFVRSDTLPHEHKGGWFRRPVTLFQTVLVFRRSKGEAHHVVPRTPAAAMPPPVVVAASAPTLAVAPPDADLPPPPPVAAPAASRFTPPPLATRPANDATPVAMPPPPSLTLVKPGPDAEAPAADPNPRLAAE
jgi:hypothetical protein